MKFRVILDEQHLLIVFALLAVLLTLLIWRTFRKWSASSDNTFSVSDLFMENGRASKGAVVLLGAFAATTWMFVYYTILGKMTEGYFGLYSAAWIAPIVVRILAGSPSSPASTSVVTTTETTVKP